jgi:hypothetical protein
MEFSFFNSKNCQATEGSPSPTFAVMSYIACADGVGIAAKDKQVKRLLLRSQRSCAVRHVVEGETEQFHFSNKLWELCYSLTVCS